jgi:hypothetical protein
MDITKFTESEMQIIRAISKHINVLPLYFYDVTQSLQTGDESYYSVDCFDTNANENKVHLIMKRDLNLHVDG